jgi:hypothetical protein
MTHNRSRRSSARIVIRRLVLSQSAAPEDLGGAIAAAIEQQLDPRLLSATTAGDLAQEIAKSVTSRVDLAAPGFASKEEFHGRQ